MAFFSCLKMGGGENPAREKPKQVKSACCRFKSEPIKKICNLPCLAHLSKPARKRQLKRLPFLSSSGEKEREKRGHGEEAWMATPGAHAPGAISMALRFRFALFSTG
jgi:hypothetical protein